MVLQLYYYCLFFPSPSSTLEARKAYPELCLDPGEDRRRHLVAADMVRVAGPPLAGRGLHHGRPGAGQLAATEVDVEESLQKFVGSEGEAERRRRPGRQK